MDRRRIVPEHSTRLELQRVLAELQESLDAELRAVHVPTASQTLGDFAAYWLDTKIRRGDLNVNTAAVRVQVLEQHVLPTLGSMTIESLTPGVVQAWADGLALRRKANGDTYSRATLRGWWVQARTLIRDAVHSVGLPDPTVRVGLPGNAGAQPTRRETNTPTPAEVARLLDYMREHEPQWYRLTWAAANTGLRAGELLELRGRDIDEARDMLRVTRSFNGREVKAPKTRAGIRSWPLDDELVTVLRAHQPGPDDLLFPAADGRHVRRSSWYRALERASEACDLSVIAGPQVFRRYVNSRLFDAGIAPEVVRSAMGHTHQSMSLNYADDLPGAKAAIVALRRGAHAQPHPESTPED